MEQLELYAKHRKITGKKVKRLRREGYVPGILYGHDVDPIPLLFDGHDIESAVRQTSTSTLVQVNIEGYDEAYTAVFRDTQRDILKHNLIHVDLLSLNLEETVRVDVPLNLVGVSPAEEEQGGVLIQQLNEVEVEALPMALVPAIEIDISTIVNIGETITVRDITPPEGITILTAPEEIVVQVTTITEEEIEEELEEALLEPGEVEVIGKGLEEEEEMEGMAEEEEEDMEQRSYM
jgi:large subunit ribosomal protein L25